MKFYLGVCKPAWLGRTTVPLFVSRRPLSLYKRPPRARGTWALDSGGFTELSLHGRWTVEPARYADEVSRWSDEIGGLDWSAIQDYMCEPFMIERTGLTLAEHQSRTIASYLDLRALAPSMRWLPVIQGWALDDYLRHVEDYRAAGVDLAALPLVGVGSVCRRQSTKEAADIFSSIRSLGIKPHGFGVKSAGIIVAGNSLESADSMAWSYRARRSPALPGCTHKSCSNCLRFALKWRNRVIAAIERPKQLEFF